MYSEGPHDFCELDISGRYTPHEVPYDISLFVGCDGVTEVDREFNFAVVHMVPFFDR